MEPAVAGLGFPPRQAMHSLRHYYASALIHHGASVAVVQHRLGHSTPTETLNTYAHLWPDCDEETVKAITAELGGADAAVSWLCHDGTG